MLNNIILSGIAGPGLGRGYAIIPRPGFGPATSCIDTIFIVRIAE